jgi:hypothetical protein
MTPVASRRMRRHEQALPAARAAAARPAPAPPRWSRRRGVLSVFAAFAAVGFAASYIGPMGSALSVAKADEAVPVTLYATGLGDIQSLQLQAGEGEPEAVTFDRGGYSVHLIPKPTPTPTAPVKSTTVRSGWVPPFVTPDPGSAQSIAYGMVSARGWSDEQFSCLVALWNKESGWRVNAYNRSSGAYGIPQALPGSKMGSAGADWETNAATQISWGLGYIGARYGTPCGAWAHSQSTGWY